MPLSDATPMHWERVAAAPDAFRDVAYGPGGPIVRARDGAIWALRGDEFVRVAEPSALSADPDTTLIATGGRVGVLRGQPARVAWVTDGGWSPTEVLPVDHATAIAIGHDGAAWVAALFGGAAVRSPAGAWTPIDGLEGNLFVAADPTGGAWFWTGSGEVVHRPDARPPVRGPVDWSARRGALAVDAHGRPVWVEDGLVRAGERVADLPAGMIAVAGDAVWAAIPGGSARWTDAGVTVVPFPPGRVASLGVADDGVAGDGVAGGGSGGEAWAVADGWAWRARPGEGLGLARETSSWVAALAGLRELRVGDLDGDGRDDLVAADPAGALRAFRQVGDELVDRTVELVDAPIDGRPWAVCDLDEDGRGEVLVRGGDDGPPLRWLRWRGGRLVEETAAVGLPAEDADLRRSTGAATCADLTGDGHPDLAVAGGGALAGRVWLWANDGTGHLAQVALPARGLQVPGSRVYRLHPADLDGDGVLDVLLAAFWGLGHTVLRGVPGGWQDVSAASGLAGVYATPTFSWLADVDGDGAPDFVEAGSDEVRVWQGRGLRFEDRTDAWGLGPADRGATAGVLADLSGDGYPDLVMQHPDGAFSAFTGGPDGFTDRGRELPALPGARAGLVAIDIGGDGADLLVTTATEAQLLRGRGSAGLKEAGEASSDGGGAATRSGSSTRPPTTAAPSSPLREEVPRSGGGGASEAGGVPRSGGGGAVGAEHSQRSPLSRAPQALARAWSWTPIGIRAAVGFAALAWLASLAWIAGHAGPRRSAGREIALWLLGFSLTLAAGWLALDTSAARAVPAIATAWTFPAAAAAVGISRRRRDGARIVGGWRLGRVLGEGASGIVFEASSVATGERVAIKRLRHDPAAQTADRDVFRREAELGAAVDHPNVVRILGYGEWRAPSDEAPAAWLVLELLPGPTLRDVLDRLGPLPVDVAAGIGRDLARGLEAIHDAGVLHRDVKPQNVAFAAEGTVKLMDFGAARPTRRRTETVDRFLGTVGYLSPERLRGATATVRSDIYALGVVLYECLAGVRPVDDLATLALASAPPRPARADLPDSFWDIVVRAISPDPAARFASARELADALEPFARAAALPALPRAPTAAAAPRGSHVAIALGLLRAYLRYAREGGRPDADAFAARWLARSRSESAQANPGSTDPISPPAARTAPIRRVGDGGEEA